MRANELLAWSCLACLAACAEEGAAPTPPPGEPSPWGVPISGGTMLVTRDGARAVIADPDANRVLAVDLATWQVIGDLRMLPGDEPGRVIEDGAGRIHV